MKSTVYLTSSLIENAMLTITIERENEIVLLFLGTNKPNADSTEESEPLWYGLQLKGNGRK